MHKRERLVTETLGDNPGEAFARQAAAQVRRRRVLSRISLAAAAATAVVAGFVVTLKPVATPAPALPPVATGPTVQILSDQELLAELKDQPVLIIRDQSRITGVVFLAEKSSGSL